MRTSPQHPYTPAPSSPGRPTYSRPVPGAGAPSTIGGHPYQNGGTPAYRPGNNRVGAGAPSTIGGHPYQNGGAPAYRPGNNHVAAGAGAGHPAYAGAGAGHGGGVSASHSFMYHGHTMQRFRAAPYRWPGGYGYQHWGLGLLLPPVFWSDGGQWVDWQALGLDPPCCGWRWIRYGPDVLLIDPYTGQIHGAVYGVFLDDDG